MNFNDSIPGWALYTDIKILATLTSLVPENGKILEVGCFLGRTTYVFHSNKKSGVSLDVVDCFNGPWLKNETFQNLQLSGDIDIYNRAKLIGDTISWEQAFRYCIGEEVYKSINLYPTTTEKYTPSHPYDLVYIDASHTYEDVLHDINKFTSANTLCIGDDYNLNNPDVSRAVNEARNTKMLVVWKNSKTWALVPGKGYWFEIFKNNNLFIL